MAIATNIAWVSLYVGMHVTHVHDERIAGAKLQRLGAFVKNQYETEKLQPRPPGLPDREPRGAPFLRRLLGDDIFERVDQVDLEATLCKDADLAAVVTCRYVSDLRLSWTSITNAGIERVAKCNFINFLVLDGTHVTDKSLVHLRGLDLEYLSIHRTRISDKAVAEFRRVRPNCYVDRESDRPANAP